MFSDWLIDWLSNEHMQLLRRLWTVEPVTTTDTVSLPVNINGVCVCDYWVVITSLQRAVAQQQQQRNRRSSSLRRLNEPMR